MSNININELVNNTFKNLGMQGATEYYNRSVNSVDSKVIESVQELCSKIKKNLDVTSEKGGFYLNIQIDTRLYSDSVIVLVKQYLKSSGFLVVSFGAGADKNYLRWSISWGHLGELLKGVKKDD